MRVWYYKNCIKLNLCRLEKVWKKFHTWQKSVVAVTKMRYELNKHPSCCNLELLHLKTFKTENFFGSWWLFWIGCPKIIFVYFFFAQSFHWCKIGSGVHKKFLRYRPINDTLQTIFVFGFMKMGKEPLAEL